MKRYPHETADGLFRTLRAIVSNPGDGRNPTPDACPFEWKYPSTILKRGKEFKRRSFRNLITEINKRIQAGEFADIPGAEAKE